MASIRKLRDGRWQAQYRPVPGGRQITRTTQRKADAQRWLDEQRALLITGNYADPSAGRITFGEYFLLWSARQVWTQNTVLSISTTMQFVSFRDIPLRLLRRSHLESWVKSMQTTCQVRRRGKEATDGLAPTTIRLRFTHVRTVLKAAVADKRLVSDPSAGMKLPRVRRGEAVMRLPSIQQVRSLLAVARPEFRAFIALCAFAGLRRGEARAVQLKDIDFANGILIVARQIVSEGERIEIRAPKYGSERRVSLPNSLIKILSTHSDQLPGKHAAESWLFSGTSDRPIKNSTVTHWWEAAKSAAGVDGVRLHDLRHFFASGLIAANCDVVTVQRALGHSSATMTLGTYAHLWPRAEDRTRRAAAAMLADVLGSPDEYLTNEVAA
jgi:integrase